MVLKIINIFFLLNTAALISFSQSDNHRTNYNTNYTSEKGNNFPGYANYDTKPKFHTILPDFEYNEVRAIIKDYKGFMWFGTTYGLIKYDGVNLYVYESDPEYDNGLRHKSINALAEDQNHNLWIGTSGGLNRYDREKDYFTGAYPVKGNTNYLNNTFISSLCVYNGTILLAGTYTEGLNVYDPVNETIINYSYNPRDSNSISSSHITCIAVDKADNIWVGTDNGLNLFINNKRFKP